jgi:hypothetical protein
MNNDTIENTGFFNPRLIEFIANPNNLVPVRNKKYTSKLPKSYFNQKHQEKLALKSKFYHYDKGLRALRVAIYSFKNGSKFNHNHFSSVKLPYSRLEFLEHMQSQFDEFMNWNNYGSYWHIDHIKPNNLFEYESDNDLGFQQSFALNNLRPLEKFQNMQRSNKMYC